MRGKINIFIFVLLLIYLSGCTESKTLSISFDSNGGENISMKSYDLDSNVELPTPVKDGYVFLGWYMDNHTFETPFDLDSFNESLNSKSLKLYASWELASLYENNYDFSFYLNDTEIYTQSQNKYKTYINEPIDPVKSKYYFSGWYTNLDYLIQWNFENDIVMSNQNLYAKWIPEHEFLIKYISDNFGNSVYTSNDSIDLTLNFKNDPDEYINEKVQFYKDGTITYRLNQTLPDKLLTEVYGLYYISLSFSFTYGSNENVKVNYSYAKDQRSNVRYSGSVDDATILNMETGEMNIDFADKWLGTEKNLEDALKKIQNSSNSFFKTFKTIQNNAGVNMMTDFYKINFHSEQSTPIVYTFKPGDQIHLPTTYKENHHFINWYYDNEFSSIFDHDVMPSYNINLYSKFEIDTFEYHFMEQEVLTHVEKIELGLEVAYIFTPDNRVYSLGVPENYLLGLGSEKYYSSLAHEITKQFPLYNNETILSINSSSTYSVSLTSQNRIFIWGDFFTQIFKTPVEYTLFNIPKETTIDKIIAMDKMILVFANNKVYGYGYVDYMENYNNLILSEDEQIVDVFEGDNHYFVKTSKGQVIGLGYGESGQLGNGTYTNATSSINDRINLSANESIKKVSAGAKHTLVLTSDYRIFSFGDNASYQLGNGNNLKIHTPIDITHQFALEDDEYIIDIKARNNVSLSITNLGSVYIWGSIKINEFSGITTKPQYIGRFENIKDVVLGKKSNNKDVFSYLIFNDGSYKVLGGITDIVNGTFIDYFTPFNYKYAFRDIPIQAWKIRESNNYEYGQTVNSPIWEKSNAIFDAWYSEADLKYTRTFPILSTNSTYFYSKWFYLS